MCCRLWCVVCVLCGVQSKKDSQCLYNYPTARRYSYTKLNSFLENFSFQNAFLKKSKRKNIHKIAWYTVLDVSASRFTDLRKDRQKQHQKTYLATYSMELTLYLETDGSFASRKIPYVLRD